MKDENEPYEVMPEGDATQFIDKLTKIVSLVMLILIGVLLYSLNAKAEGRNWCGDYADGYLVGYCWTRKVCDYVPPVICPSPEDGQVDGYVVGLRDGLEVGGVK